MKRVLFNSWQFCALIVVVCFTHTALSLELPGKEPNSPWSITLNASSGYDDNLFTSHQDQIGSWFSGTDLSFRTNKDSDRLSYNLGVGGGMQYYYNRPEVNDTYSAFTSGNINYSIDPRWQLKFSDNLNYEEQPEPDQVLESTKNLGAYVHNDFRGTSSYEITPRLFSDFQLFHEGKFYRNEFESRELDYQTYGISPSTRYLLSPRTTINGTYRFEHIDYLTSERDAHEHTFSAGLDHKMSTRLNVTFDAGWQLRQEDNALSNDLNSSPFVQSTASYQLSPSCLISGSVKYGFDESDNTNQQITRSLTSSLRLNWSLSRNLSLNSSGVIIYQDYENLRGNSSLSSETIYQTSESIVWSIYKDDVYQNMNVTMSFSHTTADSDLEFRKYDRNVTTVSMQFLF